MSGRPAVRSPGSRRWGPPVPGGREGELPGRSRGGRRRGEEGFALIMTVLALAVLTALVTGGMLISGTEQSISRNHAASVEAGNVARAGLAQYLASYAGGLPAASATYAYGDDTAYVSADTVIAVDDEPYQLVYEVSSRGVRTDPGAGGEKAERTVSRLMLYDTGALPAPGAASSASGLRVSGGSGNVVDGTDQCGNQNEAGGAVPPGGNYSTSGNPTVQGNPPVDSTRAAGPLLRYTRVDSALWEKIRAGDLGIRDYTVPPDANWPSLSTDPPFTWPTIYIDADEYTLDQSHSGHGLIIARGDVNLMGTFEWKGLMLIGGWVDAGGNSDVEGAVVTGYNRFLGSAVSTSSVGGTGSVEVRYNSCYVTDASTAALERVMGEPGTAAEAF